MIARIANSIGWGFFCTASWTWCIGMYLPIILIRHWGWPGFLVFAIPNVLGCAGFGYLCRRETSVRLCREHAGAMVVFSAVTVAYQLFFVGWVAGECAALQPRFDGTPSELAPIAWIAPAVCLFVAAILSLAPDRWWPWLGALTTAVSYAAWTQFGVEPLAQVSMHGDAPLASLAPAAAIIVFGFLLCPWLDRTFHRARHNAPSAHAFGVFGLSFLVVIVMTVAYGSAGRLSLATPVLAHLATQLLFTVAVHVRELRLAPVPHGRKRRQAVIIVPALVGIFAAETARFPGVEPETIYLLFLGCYGLLFPAYVLFFMRTDGWPLTRVRVGWFVMLVLVLSPFAARGFLTLETWLLPIPVVVLVLLAFVFSRAKRAIGSAAEEPSR